jgi:Tfp pilus assembly protein PilF
MRPALYCLALIFAVVVIAHSGPPRHHIKGQQARAWSALGVGHLSQGEMGLARACFNNVRSLSPPHSLLWNNATVILAVICEREGKLDEANYYFASEKMKHHAFADTARTATPGAWRNIRKIVERRTP